MKKNIEFMVDIPYNSNDKNYIIEFYQKENGVYPVIEFLDSIEDKKLLNKALRNINLLQEWGNNITERFSKHIRDGIYELRIVHGNNHVRILYFFDKNRIIVLTNAFYKKTDRIENKEIDKAYSYRQDYQSRKEE